MARTALAGQGFDVSSAALDDERRALAAAGQAMFERVRQAHPEWVEPMSSGAPGVPSVADFARHLGFGARLYDELRRGVGGDLRPDADAEYLAALFNAAIVQFDRLVDVHLRREEAISLPIGLLVRRIFAQPALAVRLIGVAAASTGNPGIKHYLRLMQACARTGAALRRRGGPAAKAPWATLRDTVLGLFESHHLLARRSEGNDPGGTIAHAMRKSVLPVVAIVHIGVLADPSHAAARDRAVDCAQALGEVLSLVDDLADALDDVLDGEVNRILPSSAGAGGDLSDAKLYQCAEAAAVQLVAAIDQLRPGPLEPYARVVAALWLDWKPAQHRGQDEPDGPLGLAIAALLQEREAGYMDATHQLHMPRGDRSMQTHGALLAQRAVVLEALLDARDIGAAIDPAVLAAETMRLLQAKHPAVRGGWNYIQAVTELPPDADDLGQVVQALARMGGPDLAQTGEEGIRMLLDSQRADGGVLTWVIDPAGRGDADAAVRAYLPIMGGWGVHPEVVANFACGLLACDPVRYDGPLRRIASYLASVQQAQGCWVSHWYRGPYYGTFKALAVLCRLAAEPDAVARAASFLRDGQHREGGWGIGSAPDPLSTALALCGLAELGDAADDAALLAGTRWLCRAQDRSGRWPAVPWIEFWTQDGTETFASGTLTGAFCVKALAAMTHRFGRQRLRDAVTHTPVAAPAALVAP